MPSTPLLLRRDAMMSRPATRSKRPFYNALRFHTAPRGNPQNASVRPLGPAGQRAQPGGSRLGRDTQSAQVLFDGASKKPVAWTSRRSVPKRPKLLPFTKARPYLSYIVQRK